MACRSFPGSCPAVVARPAGTAGNQRRIATVIVRLAMVPLLEVAIITAVTVPPGRLPRGIFRKMRPGIRIFIGRVLRAAKFFLEKRAFLWKVLLPMNSPEVRALLESDLPAGPRPQHLVVRQPGIAVGQIGLTG